MPLASKIAAIRTLILCRMCELMSYKLPIIHKPTEIPNSMTKRGMVYRLSV